MSELFEDLTWRGLISQSTDPELGRLLNGEPLTVYFGCDPTASSLQVGNLVGLVTMRRLQQAGHNPIMLAGGSTGMIGDPSFKATERKLLDTETLAANIAGIERQLRQFLDFEGTDNPAILVNNYDWTHNVSVLDFLRDTGKHFTVNQMIAKESVRARLNDRDQGISFTEFSYSLLQAFDYLHLYREFGCTLQVGGNDQWGNIVAGVDLVRRSAGAKVNAFCWPLATKADGTKLGKTESGTVWLDPVRTSPYAFHQFFLRAEDEKVGDYLKIFTFLSHEEIDALIASTQTEARERRAQKALADAVTTLVHGDEETRRAKHAAELLFSGDIAAMDEVMLTQVFADVPAVTVARSGLGSVTAVDLLTQAGLSPSKTAARTAIDQGGASINGEKVSQADVPVEASRLLHGRYLVLRRGKKEFALASFE